MTAEEVPEREVVRRGWCIRCGQCCFMSKALPGNWASLKPSALGEEFREAQNIERSATVAISDRCHLLIDEEDGKTKCADFENRPRHCISYPDDRHALIEGCGYWFVLLIDGEERKTYGTVRE